MGVAVRRERNPSSIRRPAWAKVSGLSREIPKAMRGKIEQPDIGHAIASSGDKRERQSVRGKGRLVVVGRVVRKPLKPTAVRMDAVDIRRSHALRRKDNPLPV